MNTRLRHCWIFDQKIGGRSLRYVVVSFSATKTTKTFTLVPLKIYFQMYSLHILLTTKEKRTIGDRTAIVNNTQRRGAGGGGWGVVVKLLLASCYKTYKCTLGLMDYLRPKCFIFYCYIWLFL